MLTIDKPIARSYYSIKSINYKRLYLFSGE